MHQFDRPIYLVGCHQRMATTHILSTRYECDHCRTCQLKIIRVRVRTIPRKAPNIQYPIILARPLVIPIPNTNNNTGVQHSNDHEKSQNFTMTMIVFNKQQRISMVSRQMTAAVRVHVKGRTK